MTSGRDPSTTLTPPGTWLAEAMERGLDPEQARELRARLEAGERRGWALQQLQQITSTLSRTLDEEAILTDLARGFSRALDNASVVVAMADDASMPLVAQRHVRGGIDLPLITLPVEASALGEALRSGQERLLHRSVSVDQRTLGVLEGVLGPATSVLAVPLMQGRRLLGALVAYTDHADGIHEGVTEFAATVASTAAAAIRNARLYAESERERRQSDALADAARAAGESLRATEVQRLIMRHAMALLRADGACVAVRDGEYLHIDSAAGIASVLAGVVIPVQGSLSGKVVERGEPCISNAVADDPDAYRRNLRLVSVERAVIVPLRGAHGTIGSLAVYNRLQPFGAEDARILQRLADQVAVAMVNARLFADLQESTREWSSTFEALGVGMAVVNDQGRVLRCNSRARQLSGDERTFSLIGRPFYQALLGRAAPAEGEPDPLASAVELGVRQRGRCTHADGVRAFDIHATPHLDGGAVVTFDLLEP
jgi:GAF domain-containing protein